MRKLLPLAALLAMTGAAFAADVHTGRLASMDPTTGMVTLTTGQSFIVSNPILLHGLLPGELVDVTINDNGTIGLSENSGNFN